MHFFDNGIIAIYSVSMTTDDISRRTDAATARLRQHILSLEDGALIGSEEALITLTGVSRSTLRQAARMLEGEGLLKVKRGVGGGYYATRPDLSTIQAAVSGYLQTVHVKAADAVMIATALWCEAMEQAASADGDARAAIAKAFRLAVPRIADDASYSAVLACERQFREQIFDLIESAYIKLIFQINSTMAAAHFRPGSHSDGSPGHLRFVRDWRVARLLEIAALECGDQHLCRNAAQNMRRIWNRRVEMSRRDDA